MFGLFSFLVCLLLLLLSAACCLLLLLLLVVTAATVHYVRYALSLPFCDGFDALWLRDVCVRLPLRLSTY